MPNPYGQFVPDPLAPSGYRWQRHGEQPATSMLPIVEPTPQPRTGGTIRYDEYEDHQLSGQDDLSEHDRDLDIVNTEKYGPLDEVLVQPPQDPAWRPVGETT